MRLWKVNSFSRARWTLHLTPHWRDNWRRNRSQINRNGIRLLSNLAVSPRSQFVFALCSQIYSSSPLSASSSASASPPDSSCLFAPNSVIIKQSFIVRVCVVINDCFYAKKRFENWIRIGISNGISSGISNSGCSFRTMTMTDTRGQSKRMTEWDTSRIWKAKSISMPWRERGRKGAWGVNCGFVAAASIKSAAC